MTEQQLAAVKQAHEALQMGLGQVSGDYDTAIQKAIGAVAALQSIIEQQTRPATREEKIVNPGVYEVKVEQQLAAPLWKTNGGIPRFKAPEQQPASPLSNFVRSSDEAKAEVMERVIDKAIEEQKSVIGCVNHDCDECKAREQQLSPYQIGQRLRREGLGVSDIWGSVSKDSDMDEAQRGYDDAVFEQQTAAREPLTDFELASACLSYRHDFGLMDASKRDQLMFQAREWARAFGLEIAAAPQQKDTK